VRRAIFSPKTPFKKESDYLDLSLFYLIYFTQKFSLKLLIKEQKVLPYLSEEALDYWVSFDR
jgi:hypothetical protein